MTNDLIKDFLKKDIEFYVDLMIYNEEQITHHLKRRLELKEKLELLERQLHDHLKHLEEYQVKE